MDDERVTLGFDVKETAAMLEKEEWQPDWDNPDQEMRSVYLGRMIWPSGKYYTPYANSNVDPCPDCKGEGTLKNPNADRKLYHYWRMADTSLRIACMETYGPAYEQKWPDVLCAAALFTHESKQYCADTITCNRCGGIGSEEAYLDETWWTLADQIEEFSVECGEGDPTDVFATQYRDKE